MRIAQLAVSEDRSQQKSADNRMGHTIWVEICSEVLARNPMCHERPDLGYRRPNRAFGYRGVASRITEGNADRAQPCCLEERSPATDSISQSGKGRARPVRQFNATGRLLCLIHGGIDQGFFVAEVSVD